MTKKNSKIAKVLSIITIFILFSSGSINLIQTTRAAKPPEITYSWNLDTYSTEVTTTWDQTSFLMNHTGTYTDVFNYSYGHAISSDEWLEEETIFTYDINYTYVSNTTLTGNFTMRTVLDGYRVDVSYGTGLDLIWLALKNGTYEMDVFLGQNEQDYTYSNEFYRKAETTYNKYNMTTMSLIDSWNDTVEDQGNWTSTPLAAPEYEYYHFIMKMDFTMPLILTFEIYETENNEKVAWAEMFSDFWVFNDTDKNAVYSLGETKTAPMLMSMQTSDEQCGGFIPWAVDTDFYLEVALEGQPPLISNYTMKFPGDYGTNEIASWIEFTPPELSGTEVNWDINYQDYPIWANIQPYDENGLLKYTYYCGWDAPYSTTSSGNFSYGFNFGVDNNRADLDLTTSLPRLSNTSFYYDLSLGRNISFYEAVQGLSLAIPHYSFFLSSADLKEKGKKIITIPSNLFQYDINDTQIAEINMGNEDKKYYTLYDYPDNGETRQFQSIGSTVSKLISSSFEFNPTTPRNYFLDMIFTIKDLSLVKNDPDLVSPYTLYNIQIQNYPEWSGEKLVHDPTFSAYFKSGEDVPEQPDQPFIPGFHPAIIIGTTVSITTIVLLKSKKRREKKF